MKIAALIPARLGSRRLPQKNIRKLHGKPLLFWSIDVALQAECFDIICVSTESQKVIELVRQNYSARDVLVLKRPEGLASDSADLRDVCRHFLDKYHDVDMLHLMMPTYPFRNAERIKHDIIPTIYSGQVERVISILPNSFSTFDYWIRTGKNYARMYKYQPLWCEAGNAAYPFMKREYFYKKPSKWPYDFGERELKISTTIKESIDIDTKDDFYKAEKIALGHNLQCRKIVKVSSETHEYIVPEGLNIAAFKEYLFSKGCDLSSPILILDTPPPYFTFLRVHNVGNRLKQYQREITIKIIKNLPEAGHSQDFPEHFIHSRYYRVLRKDQDSLGIMEKEVPKRQVIFYTDLRSWPGFIEPFFWVR